jgi:N-acetyl-D-muramate 6-phosphate phosphatase
MNGLRVPACVLFDLDGTLADTAPDLALALNRTLAHYGRPPLPYERIRPVVSHGGIALIRLGFGMTPETPGFDERRQLLLDIYADNLCCETRLFDGMGGVLARLENDAIPWGIVTNKPGWLTMPLVERMGLASRLAALVSGDTLAQRKPHPEPIRHACSLVPVSPDRTWYVGDAGRDMLAGRAAGCNTIAAEYGYLHPEDPASAWDADARIASPTGLLDLLDHVTG